MIKPRQGPRIGAGNKAYNVQQPAPTNRRTIALCYVIMLLQGADAFGISYVAPLLGEEHGIEPEWVGLIFTASVVGTLLGAIGLAPLSDRLGRRRILLWSVLMTGLPSLLIPLTSGVAALALLRLLVGMGFGASLPATVALVSEVAVPHRRGLLVTLTSTCAVVGTGLSGLATSLIVPRMGWHALLYASGVASMVVAVLGALFLPVSHAATPESVARPGGDPRVLISAPFLRQSLLLCLMLTTSSLVVNFAAYWLPTIIVNQGYSIRDTGFIGSGRQLLTVLTGLAAGWSMDRLGYGRLLVICHALATALFLGISGLGAWPVLALGTLLFAVALFSAGTSGSLALISSLYPPQQRATALGWVHGIARLVGGSIGTSVGGVLVGARWTQSELAIGICCVALTSLVTLLALLRRPRSGEGQRVKSSA
jgi:AAHS family 4-hydroxybenzoate transporter-like MFS transporter